MPASPLGQSKIYYSAPTFDHSSPTLPPILEENPSKKPRQQPNTARNNQQQKKQFSIFGTDNTPKTSRLVVERLRHDKTKDISQIVAAGDTHHKGRAIPTTPRRRNHIDNQFDIKDKKSMRDELLPDAEFVKRIFYTMANRQGGAIDSGQFEEAACVVFGRVNGIDLDQIPAPARDAHGLLMERVPNQKKMTLENFHVSLVAAGYFMLMQPLFTIRKFATAKEFEFLAKNLGIEDPGNALKELDPKETGKFSLRDFVWWAASRTCEGEFVLDLLPMKALSVSSPRTAGARAEAENNNNTTAGRCAVSPRLADILSEKEKLRGTWEDNNNTTKNNNFQLENTKNNKGLPSIHGKNSSVSPQQQNRANNTETPRTSDSLSSINNKNHRRVVARRGKAGGGVRGGNNDNDDEANDDIFSFDGTMDEDQKKVRQAMKDSIQDSETSTTLSAPPEKMDQATSMSLPPVAPSPPKEPNQPTRRFPRKKGGAGPVQRTYPVPKNEQPEQQQEVEEEEDPHMLTQPVIPSSSQQNNSKNFANSNSIFNEKNSNKQPDQSNLDDEEGEDQDQTPPFQDESFHHLYNNQPHAPRNIKDLGVISTKKSIHGNKLIVNTQGGGGLLPGQQQRNNSLTPIAVGNGEKNINRENSFVSQQQGDGRTSAPGAVQNTNGSASTGLSRSDSNNLSKNNGNNNANKKTVQVQHNHQPTSGRYKKKGKLQEIL